MTGASVEGSRILVTGASSGIGRELALQLAGKGALLAVAARRRERLQGLAEEIERHGHARPEVIEADLSVRGEAGRVAAEASSALGGVEVLVNNAGGGVGGRICAVGDRDEGREAFEVNYWSPLALAAALVPAMLERGRGAVVNVTSMAQVNTWPGFGAYAATKAALGVATETLRMELEGTGVRVIEAIPGPIDTAVQGETRLAPGIDAMLARVPLGDAAEMARRIVDALEHGRPRVIYPRRAAFAYVFPTLVRRDIRRLAARTARQTDPSVREALEGLVVRTGSMGDDITRHAREEWERSRGRA
jgi:short-subunit dehydrogenase